MHRPSALGRSVRDVSDDRGRMEVCRDNLA